MNLLANLNIKTKVFLVTATGILGFIAYFSYVMITGLSAQARLETMQEVDFPALELANKNLFLEERIKELLANAVSTGEAEALDQAKSSAATIESNLKDLKRLLPEKSAPLNKLESQLESYSQLAFELTDGMLSGTLDFSKIGEMANQKNAINEQFLEGLTSLRNETYKEFVQNSDDVHAALSNNVRTGIIIGLITVGIMIAASWAVAGFIDLTIKSITKSLREIAQGDGDLTKRIERKSNDELGDLVHWFNVFVEKLQKTIRDRWGY
jgi:methyl-accepting chemotaxis protein